MHKRPLLAAGLAKVGPSILRWCRMCASSWLTWTPSGESQYKSERVGAGFEGFEGSGTTPSPIISTDVGDRPPSPPATSESEIIQTPPAVEPSKPSLPGMTIEQVRKHRLFAPLDSPKQAPSDDYSRAGHPKCAQHNQAENVCAPLNCPPLPMGLRLIRYVPKTPPVKLDDSSSVTNLKTFLDAELRELGA